MVSSQQAAVREALPKASVYADLNTLLALPRLDLIVIATPERSA